MVINIKSFHDFMKRRLPAATPQANAGLVALPLSGLKFLSLFEAKGYPILHSIKRANENGAML